MTAWVGTTSVTLSNSNLTATKTNNSDRTVLSDTSYSSGKRVFSIILGSSVTNLGPGLARPGSNAAEYPGDNATSLSIISGTGIYYNGGATTPSPTWSASDVCYIAVDFGASRMWWKDGAGGTWNGTAAGDPDAGTNGYDISALQNSGALLPALGMFTNGTSATLDPTASGHGLSTFTPWDSSGAQSITGALVTNSQTFYGATVGRGAVNIDGALVTNAQTFYGATVAASYGIAGGKFDNSQTFYQATVAPGAVDLAGELYTNTQTFYGATVSQASASQDITAALFTNVQSFLEATVSVDIAAELFSNEQVFYGAAISTDETQRRGGGSIFGRYASDDDFQRIRRKIERERRRQAKEADDLSRAYDKAAGIERIAEIGFQAVGELRPESIPSEVREFASTVLSARNAGAAERAMREMLAAIAQRRADDEEATIIALLLAA